ncbi:MAG: hypothetical protein LBB05_01515 [Puniceicoccales bacterium]|jgi:hypothetical protein|nr:hypothetical protein [Puniceicoccales bacterium]
MARELTLKKVSKNDIFIENIFYGREIRFTFPADKEPLEFEICRQDTQFPMEIKLSIGRYPCSLFLESLPPLVIFSKSFEGIDLFSIPEGIRLLVFQAATDALQKHFSNILGVSLTINSINTIPSPEPQNGIDLLQKHFSNILGVSLTINSINTTPSPEPQHGIDFVVTSGKIHVTAGTLVAPKEILALLAKKITNIPNLHNFRNLEASYRFCVGSTQLSKNDYQNLREEDIMFLDQYELAKLKIVDIVGFEGVKVLGTFAETGVTVEQIVQ